MKTIFISYFCIPESSAGKCEAWMRWSNYVPTMIFVNESRWIVPGTISEEEL